MDLIIVSFFSVKFWYIFVKKIFFMVIVFLIIVWYDKYDRFCWVNNSYRKSFFNKYVLKFGIEGVYNYWVYFVI